MLRHTWAKLTLTVVLPGLCGLRCLVRWRQAMLEEGGYDGEEGWDDEHWGEDLYVEQRVFSDEN